MTCHVCNTTCKKFGKFGSKKIQRYRCTSCCDIVQKKEMKAKIVLDKNYCMCKNICMRWDIRRLHRARLEKGMSASALGKALGLHPSTILKIEQLGSKPETIKKIADYLHIPIAELIIDDLQSDGQGKSTSRSRHVAYQAQEE